MIQKTYQMNNMEAKKEITDFDCCPHCGDDGGYYTKFRVGGTCHDNTSFDHVEKLNTEMWDALHDTWSSAWYYCMECNKKICKVSK